MPVEDVELERSVPGIRDFPTTRWSAVLAAGDSSSPGAWEALEKLCRTYWQPLYVYIRRLGHGPDEARDLAQDFFARFLEKKHVRYADPERGRFRTFLMVSVKRFLVNEWRHAQAEKRGAGQALISLDQQRCAEASFVREPVDPAETPDQAFERRWALSLLDQVLSNLRLEYAATDTLDQFDALIPLVWGDGDTASQAEIAVRLGITGNALRVSLHRMRRRYGELLRVEIADTVASPAEIDAELRHLIEIIRS